MVKLLFAGDGMVVQELDFAHFHELNYGIVYAYNARDALRLLFEEVPDCVILYNRLSDSRWYNLYRCLEKLNHLPVIFLSELGELAMQANVWNLYLEKKLEQDIRTKINLLQAGCNDSKLRFKDLLIDMENQIISYRGKPGEFTLKEFEVLAFLARHPRQAFSYERIFHCVWNFPIVQGRHNLQVVVSTLRKKLTQLCEGRNYIETVPRFGYSFTVSDDEETYLR